MAGRVRRRSAAVSSHTSDNSDVCVSAICCVPAGPVASWWHRSRLHCSSCCRRANTAPATCPGPWLATCCRPPSQTTFTVSGWWRAVAKPAAPALLLSSCFACALAASRCSHNRIGWVESAGLMHAVVGGSTGRVACCGKTTWRPSHEFDQRRLFAAATDACCAHCRLLLADGGGCRLGPARTAGWYSQGTDGCGSCSGSRGKPELITCSHASSSR